MAKLTIGKGLTDYIAYLQKMEAVSDDMIKKAVYEMAKIVADKVRSNLQALPTVPNSANIGTYKKGYSRLSDKEKAGLLESFGISPMENDSGYINVKLGFSGYNDVETRKYPMGQPNALIARITESGSSYRKKTPFIRPAVNASKKQAEQGGRIIIDEQIAALSKK